MPSCHIQFRDCGSCPNKTSTPSAPSVGPLATAHRASGARSAVWSVLKPSCLSATRLTSVPPNYARWPLNCRLLCERWPISMSQTQRTLSVSSASLSSEFYRPVAKTRCGCRRSSGGRSWPSDRRPHAASMRRRIAGPARRPVWSTTCSYSFATSLLATQLNRRLTLLSQDGGGANPLCSLHHPVLALVRLALAQVGHGPHQTCCHQHFPLCHSKQLHQTLAVPSILGLGPLPTQVLSFHAVPRQ